MKKIIVIMLVLLVAGLVIGAVKAAGVANIEVTGSVVTVAHQSDSTQAVRIKLSLGDDTTPLPLIKVIITGELANIWDKRLQPGMTVTVSGRARMSNDPAIALYIEAEDILQSNQWKR